MFVRRPHRIHRRFARLGREQPPRIVLGCAVPIAVGFRARLLGLALRDRVDAGPGLLLPRCSSVHTFGMKFALDVYFLGPDGRILETRRAVPPHRFLACRGAAAVLEIPV